MEVKRVEISYKYANPIRIHTLSDFHGGTKYCAESMIREKVQEIKDDPYSYWIDLGDKCEFITPSDKRYEAAALADWIPREEEDDPADCQVKWYTDMMKPIKKKCLGLLEGNHEDSIRKFGHNNVHKKICEGLGVTNLGSTCFVVFTFKRQNSNEAHEMIGVFSHGAGWAITRGSKMNRLERFMSNYPTARMAAIGHMHELIILKLPYLDVEGDRITNRIRVGAIAGCYFRTYTQGIRASYGETRDYAPNQMGNPTFIVKPSHNEVEVIG